MKIAVLVSGGVDSAVVVHRLVAEGHDLHLFYIRIGMDNGEGDCSAEEDIEMCTLLARRYNLPFEVISLHEEYWDNVMQYSLDTVKRGLTPHPDMMCNKIIKFGYFEQRRGHEFDKTATGHYATVVEKEGKFWLGTAVDPVKDQTDFLAQISYEQLSHIMFPIGSLPKAEVRRIAVELNLPNATRKDSQGICFLGKIDYNDFLRRHLGDMPGEIKDVDTGKVLGRHNGYWYHTIGQRKGLGLSGGPWYVVDKDIDSNTVYVAHGYDTPLQYGHRLNLAEMHWITEDPFASGADEMKVKFKNRHNPHFHEALMTKTGMHTFSLLSEDPIQGIAPGQYAIIYSMDEKICLGSGVITGGHES